MSQRVNDLLASGASYAMTLRALGDDAVGVTSDSIRRHSERHFPVQNAARATYREILERRAQENSVDFVDGVATAITPMALLETVMVKGYCLTATPSSLRAHRHLRLFQVLRDLARRVRHLLQDVGQGAHELTDAVHRHLKPQTLRFA